MGLFVAFLMVNAKSHNTHAPFLTPLPQPARKPLAGSWVSTVSQERPPLTQKSLWHTKAKTHNSKMIAG
jgi:hypothetical protein